MLLDETESLVVKNGDQNVKSNPMINLPSDSSSDDNQQGDPRSGLQILEDMQQTHAGFNNSVSKDPSLPNLHPILGNKVAQDTTDEIKQPDDKQPSPMGSLPPIMRASYQGLKLEVEELAEEQ